MSDVEHILVLKTLPNERNILRSCLYQYKLIVNVI
jgi:hypothetical protein